MLAYIKQNHNKQQSHEIQSPNKNLYPKPSGRHHIIQDLETHDMGQSDWKK